MISVMILLMYLKGLSILTCYEMLMTGIIELDKSVLSLYHITSYRFWQKSTAKEKTQRAKLTSQLKLTIQFLTVAATCKVKDVSQSAVQNIHSKEVFLTNNIKGCHVISSDRCNKWSLLSNAKNAVVCSDKCNKWSLSYAQW